MRRPPFPSTDTSHVNPYPDPADLHVFTPGGPGMTLGYDDEGQIYVRFRVLAIGDTFVAGELWVRGLTETPVKGNLDLNMPVVMLRLPNNEPGLTLTLRKIEAGRAFMQVTAHPSIKQKPREPV